MMLACNKVLKNCTPALLQLNLQGNHSNDVKSFFMLLVRYIQIRMEYN
jgi:hypothetical protein